MAGLLWKTIWRFLKKLNIESPYAPAIPLLGVYPEELKAGTRTDTCTPTFLGALFTGAKRWEATQVPMSG